jgi:hypothetical protein
MNKHSTTDRSASTEPMAEPVRLTAEETKQIAGGLVAAVNSLAIRCCLACGRGTIVAATAV